MIACKILRSKRDERIVLTEVVQVQCPKHRASQPLGLQVFQFWPERFLVVVADPLGPTGDNIWAFATLLVVPGGSILDFLLNLVVRQIACFSSGYSWNRLTARNRQVTVVRWFGKFPPAAVRSEAHCEHVRPCNTGDPIVHRPRNAQRISCQVSVGLCRVQVRVA